MTRPIGRPIGRRGFVASVGALAGAAALRGCARDAASTGNAPAAAPVEPGPLDPARFSRPFHGARQAGVDDAPQAFLGLVALDLAAGADRESVRRLMAVWTDDIARLTSGRAPLTDLEPELAERPSGLSVTVGWGPGAFAAAGVPPPPWLGPLPAFEIDALEDRWSGGDLVLQVCAESPVAVAHAVRRLVTGAAPMVTLRWVQRGFRDPLMNPSTQRMRNLFGQVDGTVNPSAAVAEDAGLIWDDGSVWREHATGLVVRRIAMDLDGWDRADRRSREHSVGRRLSDGAPLTGGTELTPPDLEQVGDDGFPVIDTFAHLRRAMPRAPHERFLRRPYSYDDGPVQGQVSSSGLVFIVFAADPVRQYVPVQQRLAEADLLNIWTVPVGSAVYAVLPGCPEGGILAGDLLS